MFQEYRQSMVRVSRVISDPENRGLDIVNVNVSPRTGECKIYFRIPFTGYFIGREMRGWSKDKNEKRVYRYSKLFVFRKEWEEHEGVYYFEKV